MCINGRGVGVGWGGVSRVIYPSCGGFVCNDRWGGGQRGDCNSSLSLPRIVRCPHRRWNCFGSYHKMIYLFHIWNIFIMPKSIKFSKIKCVHSWRSPLRAAVVYHKCTVKEGFILIENFKNPSSKGAGIVWVGDNKIGAYVSFYSNKVLDWK